MEDPGISRSGRIRKKSSKLADYESVDEIPPPEVIRNTDKNRRGSDEFRDSEESMMREEDFEAIPCLGAEWDNDNYNPDEEDNSLRKHRFANKREGIGSIKKHDSAPYTLSKRGNQRDISAYASWAKVNRDKILKTSPRIDLVKLNQRLRDSWGNLSKKERLLWANRARRYNIYVKSKTGIKVLQGSMETPSNQDSGLFKVVGTEPIDSAAHLKLLGESLSIIGERLTEHEGQIAVSGSLSVLLDSLLCAMGPLMCLTQQVPELNTVPQNKLSSILDNVAYIMPGL